VSGFVQRLKNSAALRVLAVYLGASWVVLQVVDVVKQNMGLPDWVFPFALVLLVIGLPVMLTTALLQGRPGRQGAEVSDSSSATGSAADGALASRRLFTWRNALLGGAAAFVLMAAVTTGFMFMRNRGIGPVGSLVAKGVLEERSRIVLADFEAGDRLLASTVTESFRVDLAQSPAITLVGPDSIADALGRMGRSSDAALNEETARELARRDGIPAVIGGELSRLGSGYVLTARLVASADGTVLASARASARDDEGLVDAIDDVSASLRERIGESYTSLRETPALAHVTTSSLAALEKYTEASEARYREEDPEAAVRLLEEAVAIDSTFALAWRDLSTVLDNLGEDRERQVEALEAAYRHRDRLTERERYLVEASYHSDVTEDRERAIEAYEAMLRLNPLDAQAMNNIGVNYYRQADFENALVWYARAYEAAPDVSLHLANVAVTRANLGHVDSAAARYAELDSFPANPLFEDWRAHFRWMTGDETGFREAIERYREAFLGARSASRAERILNGLEVLHGRVEGVVTELEAEAERQRARGNPEESIRAELEVAWLELELYGDTAAALTAANEVIALVEPDLDALNDPPWGSVGRLLIRAGDVERGLAYLDRSWQELPERRRQQREFERNTWLGFEVARAEGRSEEALRTFRSLPPSVCKPCRYNEIADLFDRAGRADSAIIYYERYLEAPFNFRFFVDSEELAPAHERLGQMYDARGDLENAALHYAQFVELWADADAPLQPRVEAARARLNEIVRKRG
jgi:tetratricopeptide (TPR) repeat protein